MSAFTKFLKVFSAVCEILIILLGNCVFGDKPADPLCCLRTAVAILIRQSPVSLPVWTFFPQFFGQFFLSQSCREAFTAVLFATPANVKAMLVCIFF